MTPSDNTAITVTDYTPNPTLDAELAALGYAATTGWPDQRPITDALVRSRLRPVGQAAPTLLATHRDRDGRLIAAAALRWPGYPHTPGRLWGPIVHPTHQRRGLGRSILTALTQRLAGSDATILTAEIPVCRAAARRLYKAAGRQPAGEAALLKRRLPLPAAGAEPPGTRLRTLKPGEDLTAALATLHAMVNRDSATAAGDAFARWCADERFTPSCLTLAEDRHGLIAAALTYPLAHHDPREPAEVLLADLLTSAAATERLSAALVSSALNTIAPTVNATVARAVTADTDVVNLLIGLGFHHVDQLRYYRYATGPRTTA